MGVLVAVPASFLRGGGVALVVGDYVGSVGVGRRRSGHSCRLSFPFRLFLVCFQPLSMPCPLFDCKCTHPEGQNLVHYCVQEKFLYITVYKRNSCTQ